MLALVDTYDKTGCRINYNSFCPYVDWCEQPHLAMFHYYFYYYYYGTILLILVFSHGMQSP